MTLEIVDHADARDACEARMSGAADWPGDPTYEGVKAPPVGLATARWGKKTAAKERTTILRAVAEARWARERGKQPVASDQCVSAQAAHAKPAEEHCRKE